MSRIISQRSLLATALTGACALINGWTGVVFEEDTDWKYHEGTTEASSPDSTAWREIGFGDANWATGRAPFWYDDGSGYSGNTDLDMRGNYTSLYLRKSFQVVNPRAIDELILDLRCDDGCIVWINGVEVARVNAPEGELAHTASALGASGEPNSTNVSVTSPRTVLVPGTNVIAIQALNVSLSGSSDFLIAAELTSSVDDIAPSMVEAIPASGSVLRELNQIEVFFDDNVQGVDPEDLLVNETPATELTVYSPRNYVFAFSEPTPGVVEVAWVPKHGITDLAPAPNAFPGGNWKYTLDPTAPTSVVVISEFMADNESGIRDNDGQRSDWIEILNLGPATIDLEGWYLTDDESEPTKWRFPSLSLNASDYGLVWASEKNRIDPSAPLHTNFKLSRGGEYLALVNPDLEVVSSFAPAYPAQRADVSYGVDRISPELQGYFEAPTPGSVNNHTGAGFAPDPVFSIGGGVFTDASLRVTLSAPTGVIRYTLNGGSPRPDSPIYSSPLAIRASTVVKARVFDDDSLPSRIVAQTYILLDSSLRDFDSNLPLLIIDTSNRSIRQDSRIATSITTIEPFRGRASLQDSPAFQGVGQIEGRGQTSAGFPKKPYNLEINDTLGNDLEVPLLGLPAESDWVLQSPYSDKTFMNNFLAFELHEKMGNYAVRRRFVEVFVDTTGGRLTYPRDYAGLYVLLEKIKVDGNRVDLARLTPAHNQEPEITGGYIVKKDKNSPGDLSFTTRGGGGFSGQTLKYHEPKPREITNAQKLWMRNYMNDLESALYASDWLRATGSDHYSHYLDVDSFVDSHWIVEFAKQIDGYRLSNYMSKDRGGTLKMAPIWDWNLSFGNADYLGGNNTSGWYYSQIGENQHIYLRRLITGRTSGSGRNGDPDFWQKIADRWSVLRTDIMAAPTVLARVDEIAAYLDEAQERDFDRWPRLGSRVWPNPSYFATPRTYAGIIAAMKRWIEGRYEWIDEQFVPTPRIDYAGGNVTSGFPVSLEAPEGSIYYRTDGGDPRASGGNVASGARIHAGPISIVANARVIARAKQGNDWSGPVDVSFVVETPPLAITEIMFRPSPPPHDPTADANLYEYIELENAGATPLDLSGYRFTRGVEFAFGENNAPILPPGGRGVLVKNVAAFAERYPEVSPVLGEYLSSLANEGERLTLIGPFGEIVHDSKYDGDEHPAADGLGFALVFRDETAPTEERKLVGGWRTGSVQGGSPGAPEPAATGVLPVLVSECLAHTDAPAVDAVELYNPNSAAVDLGGWYLSDDLRDPKFRIPTGTLIPAHGYLVFDESDFNPTPGTPPSFNLRSSGDELYLFSADDEGGLTGYVEGYRFGATLNGVSLGRHVTSTGETHFVAQAEVSLGAENATPRIGPIVISEIMYRPPDLSLNDALWDNTEDEFIELHNLTAEPVPLFDPNAPTNTWRLRDAVTYKFPMDQSLVADERVLVVSFDPLAEPAAAEAFRNRHAVDANLRMFGPYSGKLANSGESVELIQPDLVRFYTNDVVVTSVLIDAVDYTDTPPWPAAADGFGFSLQRIEENAYGNDPSNWIAARPTAGGALPGLEAPEITAHPESQTVALGADVLLGVTANAPAPLKFQWRLDGANLVGATGQTLALPAIQPLQAGDYQVVVYHAGAATASEVARVAVSTVRFTEQPVSTEADAGDEVEFSVMAISASPMHYQWRHEGAAIPNATQATLKLPRVDPADAGMYDVVIADGQAYAVSDAAQLSVRGDVTDSDGDGMPDAYEIANGLDPEDPDDAYEDADRDGMSNRDEFFAGTDPQDGENTLKLTDVEVAGDVTLRFNAVENRSYTVLYRDDLEPGEWQSLANIPVVSTGSTDAYIAEVMDANPTESARYYRIVSPALSVERNP